MAEKHKNRREEIVRVAREILLGEGESRFSVRGVAQKVGIGASTLRYYFPAQEDLLRAVADDLIAEHSAQLIGDCDIDNTSRPAVDRFVECLQQYVPKDGDFNLAMDQWMKVQIAASKQEEERARVALEATMDFSHQTIKRWVEILQHPESGPAALEQWDPDDAARFVIVLLNGLLMSLSLGGYLGIDAAHQLLRRGVEGMFNS